MLSNNTYTKGLETGLSTLSPTDPSANLHRKRSLSELYSSLAMYAFLMVVSLSGNGLVVSAYVSNKWLRKAVTHTLVIGLAMADFLVGMVSLPFWMKITFSDYHGRQIDSHIYQVYITADIFIGTASILQLTGISIERSHAILRPFRHRQLPRKTFHIAVASVWLFSALLASLQPLQYGTEWQTPYTILTASVCFFIPVMVIITAYSCILVAAKSKGNLSQRKAHKTSLEKEIRLSLTVALITMLFIIAWLPLFVLTMIATFDPESLPSPIIFARLLQFVKWMHYCSSAVNPFLYSYRNPDMRRTIAVLLRRLVLQGPGVDEVFRRRSSDISTTRVRKVSICSDKSRKVSTESQQSCLGARSAFSRISVRGRGNSSEDKEMGHKRLEFNNNI
ncbi:D(1) dopamine receptor-like [Pocillopora damicornis]|uniref:D(1) dopamine receptor-like n=1 Tax=Pocillopora damicornis TaxID=46731 RepID=UPI000F5507A0|nr:D(1) dopamine receptor-like [Pocillopora damicornis]XP_027049695.1 D(1) dopamine receptor-like [Pocillopora damicornis]